MTIEESQGQPDSAEPDEAEELSEQVPDEASGEGDTPLLSSEEHSEAPGPHGTGEVYPRGNRPDDEQAED